MKNLELRSSLIKSAILMGLCIFFIYAFAASDSGGVGGTIASLFSGVLFVVGLAFALIFSVSVLFGIYFGILYMYNQDVCKQTYDEFKEKIATSSNCISGALGSTCCTSSKEETPVAICEEDLSPLRNNQNHLTTQLRTVTTSVDSLEKTIHSLSIAVNGLTEELSKLDTRATAVEEELENKAPASSVEDSEKKIATDISTLQNSIQPFNDRLSELEGAISSLDSGNEESDDTLQAKIDQAVSGVQNELNTLKESVEKLDHPAQENDSASDLTTHRILSYFTNKKDQKKFTSLVSEAVTKEMTYAQTGELLNDSLSAEAAEIIADHPSLTKDYIRVNRQKL